MDQERAINDLLARIAILEAREEILRGTFLSVLKDIDPVGARYFDEQYDTLVRDVSKDLNRKFGPY